MDNNNVKEILSAYRPGGADAADERFSEALEQARRDPELRAWFERECARDQAITTILSEQRVLQEAKRALLPMMLAERTARRPWFNVRWLALAACAVIGFGWLAFASFYQQPSNATSPNEPRAQLAAWATGISSLDHETDSVGDIRTWLKSHGAPVPQSLPAALETAKADGCKILHAPDGTVVSVVCLMVHGQLVHMFVWDANSALSKNLANSTWHEDGGWRSYAWKDGQQEYALLGKGTQQELASFLALG